MKININGSVIEFNKYEMFSPLLGLSVIADGTDSITGQRVHFVSELGYRGDTIRNALIYSGYWDSEGKLRFQPYREGTTLRSIILEGWGRGLSEEQTLEEAMAMGYETTIEHIKEGYDRETIDYNIFLERYK